MQRVLVFTILSLTLGLAGCGDDAADSGSGSPGALNAETPEALLARFADLAKSNSFKPAEIIAFIHPDERPGFAFAMSVGPMVMAPMMMAFAPEEKQEEMKALGEDIEALLKKYGFDETGELMKEMEAQAELTPEQRLAEFNERMKDVDHVGLVRDAWALLDQMDMEEETSFDAEGFARAKASLKVDGDRATMIDPQGGDDPMILVKASDGFWYLSPLQSGMFNH